MIILSFKILIVKRRLSIWCDFNTTLPLDFMYKYSLLCTLDVWVAHVFLNCTRETAHNTTSGKAVSLSVTMVTAFSCSWESLARVFHSLPVYLHPPCRSASPAGSVTSCWVPPQWAGAEEAPVWEMAWIHMDPEIKDEQINLVMGLNFKIFKIFVLGLGNKLILNWNSN